VPWQRPHVIRACTALLPHELTQGGGCATAHCLPLTDIFDKRGLLDVVSTGSTSVDESYAAFSQLLSAHGSDASEGTRYYCVLGGPGSGKGTLCSRAAKEFGLRHLSSGQLLRAAVSAGVERSDEVTAAMQAGRPVDDGLVQEVLLAAANDTGDKGPMLLDGFPINIAQVTRDSLLHSAGQLALLWSQGAFRMRDSVWYL
jgi:hypothetical protein